MQDFQGKVAVVTGAASGIGRALVDKCAREGMKVVLADVEDAALNRAAEELAATGAQVLPVRTDVSQAGQVQTLADKTLATFGAVHVLFNNAGVGGVTSLIWQSSPADWEWVLGVNLWGVIHGIHTFVPMMLKQNDECYVVNTASIAGLISGAGLGIYKVSKHGVVSLSETLSAELKQIGSKIHVSVLCPEWVRTRITESERTRPAALRNPGAYSPSAVEAAAAQAVQQAVQSGMPATQVADLTFQAMRENKFYILTHPHTRALVEKRMSDILQDRNP